MSINFSLVLPCYNEEENIPLLYKEFSEIPLEQYRAELILADAARASVDVAVRPLGEYTCSAE